MEISRPSKPWTYRNDHCRINFFIFLNLRNIYRDKEHDILIFDGVCNFCNGFVNFIIDHDPKKRIKFLASQSKNAKKILKKYKISHNKIVDSLILIEGEKYTTRSTAFFHIVKYL